MKWKCIPLGTVCDITSSKRIFAKEYTTLGVPFYRGKEIIEKNRGNKVSTELFISWDRYNEIKAKFDVPKPGDILLTSVGTLGVPWLVDETEFYFKDGNLTWLRTGNEILSKFLYLWLSSPDAQSQIDMMSIGSTQKALTIENIKKIIIYLPPLEEQKRISAILSVLDDKIELNRRINENLEQQAKLIYKYMFIDNYSYNWMSGTLSDIANITMGQSPNGSSCNENSIGEVFYQGRAEFGFRYPTKRLYTTEPKRIAEKGDILLSVRAPVGDINVAYERCCIGRGLSAIHSKNGSSSFLLYTIFALKPQLDVFNGEGTVFGAINRNALNDIVISIPSNEIIAEFESIVQPIDNKILINYEEICRLKIIRDTLLPKLMSGELDVSSLDL